MKTHLQRAIGKLKDQALQLSAEVESNLEKAYHALEGMDVDLAAEVIAGDRNIDHREVELEEECLKILALHQPVAADLRLVVAVLKMNRDLERIGDLAANISEYVQHIVANGRIEIWDEYREIYELSRQMVSDALDSLVNADADLAWDVCRRDDKVDELNRTLIAHIERALDENPSRYKSLLFAVSVSRTFERIGDYATNIAKDVVYMVRGTIIRHRWRDANPPA